MTKKMLIDATHAEETRVVVVDGTQVDEFDFETVNKRQLAGNIYLAKVTRVEPSLQAAFVDYGGNRHGFLAFAEIHPDYYQIPAEDRRALLEEERAAAAAAEAEEDARERRQSGRRSKAAAVAPLDAAIASEAIPGMEVAEDGQADAEEDSAPLTLGVADEAAEPAEYETEDTAAEDTAAEDTAADEAEGIESVAEEDVAEEMPAPRKPRARRYKIQEVVKVRQIMLVQVVKEERGNKGAALTTYLSLAGRYCVLMPNTARGGGISRKITNPADRKKLKDIASQLEVPQGAGLIIRTAGSQRTSVEIKRDYEYLMRLWEQIRELTFRSVAPAPIYEEGDLIKRTIRDLYSKDIDEVLVEGERGFRTARDFMTMIMPDQVRAVKHYSDPMPLFARYQAESFLSGMFNPVVQLKSGGYIVIGITEALVAIDVNSGRATKEGSIEDTAYKTNCEAADEIARQLRLRDLAGLIVIDFIDMDERRNNANVEKRFKDALKTDRARIQVGRISGFGLMEMSRQRLRPGMLESTTQPCAHCHGTGIIRSDDSLALQILRAIEEEGTRKRSREVLVKAPVGVANYLINHKREHIALIEARTGMAVRIEADPSLISPDWSMEKFKTATRLVSEPERQALSVDASLMAAIDEESVEEPQEVEVSEGLADEAEGAEARDETDTEADEGEGNGRRRRRRRRRRGGRGEDEAAEGSAEDEAEEGASDDAAVTAATGEPASGEGNGAGSAEAESGEGEATGRRRRRRRRGGAASENGSGEAAEAVAEAESGHPSHEDLVPAPEQPVTDLSDDAPASSTPVAQTEEPARETAEEGEPEPQAEEAAPGWTESEERVQPAEVEDQGDAAEGGASEEAPAPVEVEAEPADAVPAEAYVAEDAAEEREEAEPSSAEEPQSEESQSEEPEAEEPQMAAAEPAPAKPKRRGWWSFGG